MSRNSLFTDSFRYPIDLPVCWVKFVQCGRDLDARGDGIERVAVGDNDVYAATCSSLNTEVFGLNDRYGN